MIRIVQVLRLSSWFSQALQTNAGICLKTLSLIFFIYYYLIIIYTFFSLSYWIPSLHKLLINNRVISRCRHVKLHFSNALCWYKLDTFQISVTELHSSWITPIVDGRKLEYIKMERYWSTFLCSLLLLLIGFSSRCSFVNPILRQRANCLFSASPWFLISIDLYSICDLESCLPSDVANPFFFFFSLMLCDVGMKRRLWNVGECNRQIKCTL